jgi:glycosyltransferase involved in cell wall biosynthesis
MSECSFTIIVPVFNSENYLSQCIDSVLNQSFYNFELLLIDDCSTDNSIIIIESYKQKDKRVKFFKNKINLGISKTRNRGIKESSGTFLLFLDSDDFLEPESLFLISENLQGDTDVLLFDHYEVRSDNDRKQIDNIQIDFKNPSNKFRRFNPTDIFDLAYSSYLNHHNNRVFGSCWGRIYRTSHIRNCGIFFNEKLPIVEDVVFNYNYLQHCRSLLYLNIYLYNYRIHNFMNSASSKLPQNFVEVLSEMYSSIEQFYLKTSNLDILTIRTIASQRSMHYFIIYLVRIWGGLYTNSLREKYRIITEYVNSDTIQNYIKSYTPREGNSKMLPFLIRMKFVLAIILFGKNRYNKRYGK